MSALPPRADIGTLPRDVRFVPKADIAQARITFAGNRRGYWQKGPRKTDECTSLVGWVACDFYLLEDLREIERPFRSHCRLRESGRAAGRHSRRIYLPAAQIRHDRWIDRRSGRRKRERDAPDVSCKRLPPPLNGQCHAADRARPCWYWDRGWLLAHRLQ